VRTRWLIVGLGLSAVLSCTEHEPELGRVGGDPLPSVGGGSGAGAADAGSGGSGNAAGTGAAGQAGAAGAAGGAGCAPVDPGIVNPAFPCDVAEIIENICQRCHSDPPQNSAPFPLAT